MKLLFDENLSHKLIEGPCDVFEGSVHLRDVGLKAADDREVWDYAKTNGFALISKDGDFHQLGLLSGPPPPVVWLRVGNASTTAIAALLRTRAKDIEDFAMGEGAVMVVGA